MVEAQPGRRGIGDERGLRAMGEVRRPVVPLAAAPEAFIDGG